MENPALTEAEQRAVLSKVTWRLVPLLFFCYIIAYIDRINVSIAKDHLLQPLGVDPATFGRVYGLGAGLFFLGYFLFEVPSNLMLQKVGARTWIARIMITWGLVSMGFMFLNGKSSFYFLRFLLGAAEAGFFPGIVLYFTYWFPAKERGKTLALFALGGVVAGAIGHPISGALLLMDGILEMAGWKWLFFIEAIPAVVMGLVVFFVLPNGPADARWLTSSEKGWLLTKIADESRESAVTKERRFREIFTSGRVWLLCLLYFLVNVAGYGYELWLPSIVKTISGQNQTVVSVLNAIPYVVAGFAMVLVARNSDRTGERRCHVSVSAFFAAVGFACAALLSNPWLAMAGMCLALAGQKSTLGPFWALATTFLSGTAAAGGIALINSVGNLGGYVGPQLVGWVKDKTKSELPALYLLGGALLFLSIVALFLPSNKPAAGPTPSLPQEDS